MDKRELRRLGGEWLREVRQQRGFPTAKSLAEALDADPSIVSRIENGDYAVDDDRAEQIAQALRMDEIETRRGLRLWLPKADRDVKPFSIRDVPTMEILDELQRRAEAAEEAEESARQSAESASAR